LMCEHATLEHEIDPCRALEVILPHPSAALVHEIILGTDDANGTTDLPRGRISEEFGWSELDVIASNRPYTLRKLTLNDRWETEDADDPHYYDISWFKLAGMKSLSKGVPDLEHLTLISGDFLDLEDLDLPKL